MAKVKILPTDIINKISAGEIIEDPSSIIKELIENSIDSSPTNIKIEFVDGGKNYILVEDNGFGMNHKDASLALHRHTTSKIKSIEDLNKITTLGFRGEALASISNVSKCYLRTKNKKNKYGSEIFFDKGYKIYQKNYPMNIGTSVQISDLFYNIPVRFKFMKTNNIEAIKIIHQVRLYILSNLNIGFILKQNNQFVFRCEKELSLIERINLIFKKNYSEDLLSIHFVENNIEIYGYISKPGKVSKSTTDHIFFFVNQRPIKDKALLNAYLNSFCSFIPINRYPLGFIFLKINPSEIDINVHPSKKEIKFKKEEYIKRLIIKTVTYYIKKYINSFTKQNNNKNIINSLLPSIFPKKSIITPQQIEKNDWNYLGELKNNQIVFKTSSGILILNYKYASQRIFMEKIEFSYLHKKTNCQILLFPKSIQFDALYSHIIKKNLNLLADIGFELENFGQQFYRMKGIPHWLDANQAEVFLEDLLDLIKTKNKFLLKKEAFKQEFAMIAINKLNIVKNNLNKNNINSFIQNLMQCKNPFICPNGNNIFIEINYLELNKRFQNIYKK